MPVFRYKGFKPGGASASGTIEADGPRDAALKLKGLGLYPREIELEAQKKSLSKRPDIAVVAAVTRQLSVMLSSDVPMIEALRALSEESRGRMKAVLIGVRERVSAGASLSRALEDYPDMFPDFFRNMVASGEASGMLEEILERLADFLEKDASVKAKLRTAMIYPVFMASIGFIVLVFMFTFVIPKIVKIFEDSKATLPMVTRVMIGLSDFMVGYWWAVLAVTALVVYSGRRLFAAKRVFFDTLLLRVPLMKSLYLSRLARTLGFLLKGGLPMLRALDLAAGVTGNKALALGVASAEKKVAEGASLSTALPDFPPVFLQLVSTGEKSGKLVDTLGRAADSYEEEFGRRVQRAMAVIGPFMILLMGIVVGYIVFAILLPMFQLNELIK